MKHVQIYLKLPEKIALSDENENASKKQQAGTHLD